MKGRVYMADSLKKILIVDDDEASRDIMDMQLRKYYQLDFAVTANEALELFKQNEYSLILMDINLGTGKNGIEVMKEIRETQKGSNTPVIAITAYANFGDKESFLDAGFDNYISKPWTVDTLLHSILDTFNMYG